jgi:RimJ/RimL family protein N-acetyltransferase
LIVYGHSEEIAEWVGLNIPHVGTAGFGPCTALGVVSSGKLIAGVVYHDYQPSCGTIQLSMAAVSPMWARRETIRDLLAYPFHQLGVYVVWTATPRDNEAALKVNLHIGFTKEAVLGHRFGPKRHAVICRMDKPVYIKRYGTA